jgi:hypothetical protein
MDFFALSVVMQEVPVSRAFEAYSTKPPQAHERILIQLFLMDEKHSENNHRGQLLVAAVAAGACLLLYNELEQLTIS